MARIRTIKPEFFRHEQLQDLEIEHPGQYCMLVFVGLWTQVDNNGIFQDRPRQLKLDILPFLDFEFEATLSILQDYGFVYRYQVNSGRYAIIPTIPAHQRFSGKESGETGSRYPLPPSEDIEAFMLKHKIDREAIGKQQGSDSEQSVSQEKERNKGKGKDREVFPENEKPKTKIQKFTESHFEKFWSEYPKKIGKGAARASFLKIKVDPDVDSMLVAIVQAVQNQSRSTQWKKDNGKFIPNPATWINQERWMDQPATSDEPYYRRLDAPPPGWELPGFPKKDPPKGTLGGIEL